MKKWRCTVCGYVHEGDEPPEKCPVCGADKSLFEEIVETPAADEAVAEKGPAAEPATAAATPVQKWRCTVCGYVHEGDEPPEKCPVCGADKSLFEPVVPDPAAAETADKKGPSAGQAPSTDSRAVDLGPEPDTPLGRMLHVVMGQMLKHHAHPISVHFPNGVLPVAFIFMALAMLFESRALETAAYCNLVFVVMALPAVLYSGYVEWQKRYKGLRSRPFTIKIACAAAVLVLSLLAVVWWTVDPEVLRVPSSGRTLFVLINLLSLGAAGVAGLIGGKLVFRD